MDVWWSVTCEKASSMLVIWSLRSQISNRWGDASGTDLTSFHLECGSVVHVDSIESIRYGSIHVTTTPNLGMIFTCIHIPTYSNLSPILLWATRIASQLQRCCKCATFWEFVAPANPTEPPAADHSLNCSTSLWYGVGSTQVWGVKSINCKSPP